MRKPTYRLFVPAGAVGANKVFFDLFNATGSGKKLRVVSLIPVFSGAVAVTGALAVDLYLTRTTAVGTGGTAATSEGTSLTAATFTKADPGFADLPALVTARLAPSGGATAGAVVLSRSCFSEETNAATYLLSNMLKQAPLIITPNSGIRIVQGGVASVGNVGFEVVFEVL